MDRNAAASLARSLMVQHDVGHLAFKFDRAKTRLGQTKFLALFPIQISLSALYVDLLPESEIREVILHEIAHAKAGIQAGHGPVWKAEARALGIKGDRCATPSASPKGSLQGVCPNGHSYEFHRMPQRVKACANAGCKGKPFIDRVLTYRRGTLDVFIWEMPDRFQMEYSNLMARHGRSL